MSLGTFCVACPAIPAAGYRNLARCPQTKLEDAKLSNREYVAYGRDIMALSDGGGMDIAHALDTDMAEIITRRLNTRLDLVLGALQVAVKATDLSTSQAFAQTAMDFLTGDHEPLED